MCLALYKRHLGGNIFFVFRTWKYTMRQHYPCLLGFDFFPSSPISLPFHLQQKFSFHSPRMQQRRFRLTPQYLRRVGTVLCGTVTKICQTQFKRARVKLAKRALIVWRICYQMINNLLAPFPSLNSLLESWTTNLRLSSVKGVIKKVFNHGFDTM
ncbi:hypothetical protein POM88_001096 [Heracleum sosnowskyi]|uniref:Uncharacterized protein n=1 Tax=Heracleum sosnowskyi TaxID=360622 RepID=A0AAD8NAE0_9APIA|nr:hypothetical protein POM88_001096 [Heracleum sosnowskyi]